MSVTPYAALAVPVHSCIREQDVVGMPVGNRGRPEFERPIGCFVNTFAPHTGLSGEPTFRDLPARVRAVCLEVFASAASAACGRSGPSACRHA